MAVQRVHRREPLVVVELAGVRVSPRDSYRVCTVVTAALARVDALACVVEARADVAVNGVGGDVEVEVNPRRVLVVLESACRLVRDVPLVVGAMVRRIVEHRLLGTSRLDCGPVGDRPGAAGEAERQGQGKT